MKKSEHKNRLKEFVNILKRWFVDRNIPISLFVSILLLVIAGYTLYLQFFSTIHRLDISIHSFEVDDTSFYINSDLAIYNPGNKSVYIRELYYIIGNYGVYWSEPHPDKWKLVVNASETISISIPVEIGKDFFEKFKHDDTNKYPNYKMEVKLIVRALSGGTKDIYGECIVASISVDKDSNIDVRSHISTPGEHGTYEVFQVK